MKRAVYAGTFDPITIGHLDVIEKASKIFDEVIIAIGYNPQKNTTMFDMKTRIEMIEASVKKYKNIKVDNFEGLLVNYCEKVGAKSIVRGFRGVSDAEYELSVGYANESLNNEISTIFFMPKIKNSFISSSTFRAIYKEGGRIDHLISKEVREMI